MVHELTKMCLIKDFDKERAKQLMKQIDVNEEFLDSKYGFKYTLLNHASTYANYEMVKLLLENGADPNLVYDRGFENVLWNLQYSSDNIEDDKIQLDIVKLLLENGANPHIKVEGEDLYYWAISNWGKDEGLQDKYRFEFIKLLEEYDV